MGDYRELDAWQSGQDLAVAIYQLTQTFPTAEKFGITAQMRRAAVSVMSNIAEGAGRGTDRQLIPFLRVARGSLHELESQCQLAQRLGFCSADAASEALRISDRTGRQLYRLLRSLSHDP
jgi:four helix bundle protein